MKHSKVLIVDDEPAIIENLAPILQRSGFKVATAADGIEALEKVFKFNPDIIVLDVDMPRLDGRSVLRQLRQQDNWVPIVLLTKLGDATDRTLALQEGADDYLNKPFESHELIARIKAILRRSQQGTISLASARVLTCGPLKFNRSPRRASLHGQDISLTSKATSLLEFFLLRPDEVLTRDRLLSGIWGWTHPTGTRAVDTRISELRKALNDDSNSPQFIETIAGVGYRWVGVVQAL